MEEYKKRIVKIIQYIDDHLDEELRLEVIAEVGAYSSFHFHRIFRMITGETLQRYITRKRIEKSAFNLALRKRISIKEIYLDLGFSNHAVFNKTFKKFYGVSPSEFRKSAPKNFHKVVQQLSKKGQISTVFDQYICNMENLLNWTNMNLKIQTTNLKEMNLAAVMSLGVADIESSFNILIDWAKKKHLFPRENMKMLSVYHDSFKVTPPDKVRIHTSMLLDERMVEQEGEVFPETIDAGRFIVGSGELPLDDFERAWVSLFLWMKENHYAVRKAPPFEIYHSDFKEHPEGKMRVDFCIPIE